MIGPPTRGKIRRVTRNLESNRLIEDLWIGRSTSKLLIMPELRQLCDMGVRLELNAVEEDGEELPWEEQPMSPSEATRFRGTAARINFLAADRPDLQYASKETSRRMASLVNGDWSILMRVARYVVTYKIFVHT